MTDSEYFNNLEIKQIDNTFAKQFISQHHYTHTCPKSSISYGTYYNNELQCVIVYGQPSGRNLASSIWQGGNENECLELLRLFSYDSCPKNIESWSISNSVKKLKTDCPDVKVLVSYADTGAGHIGYIYQASSWLYVGTSSSEHKIFIDGERQHRRSMYDKYGTSSLKVLKEKLGERLQIETEKHFKNKYIKIIKDKKHIEQNLKVKQLPYPKGDIKRYDDNNSYFQSIQGVLVKSTTNN